MKVRQSVRLNFLIYVEFLELLDVFKEKFICFSINQIWELISGTEASPQKQEDVLSFLKIFIDSPADECDDEDDPEYNFLADTDEPDVEDYRDDKAVRITSQ